MPEESLNESLVTNRDSSPAMQAQNDNKSNPQDKKKLLCHSEGGQSPTEESLLSTKDSLMESLERQLLCHSKPPIKGEELLSKTPKNTTSDSCRDSSLDSQAQNDKLTAFTRKPTEILHPLQGFRMTNFVFL